MGGFERDNRRIRRRLEAEGWFLVRQNRPHDVYHHPVRAGRVVLPRHRGDVPIGVVRDVAKVAGWI
jgi:predicted RNA binding protein YcfA (HicA-like mRNA interferase family)